MNYLDLLKLNLSFKNTFEDINNINNTHTENIYLSECATNLSKMLASYLFNQKKQNIIYITPSIYEASKAYEVMCDIAGTDNVSFFPVEEFISSELVATSESFRLARMLTIEQILNKVPQIIVTNVEGYTHQIIKKEKLEEEQAKWKDGNTKNVITLNKENIAEVIARWTGIPAYKITETESDKLRHLEENLHKRVIGQNEAVSAVAKAIRRGRVGLTDPNRPTGSFLFLGPTGVGKTELAKALAEAMFGNEDAMIRIDMSEFMESHSVAKLIGSPPGYVGYDEGGQLTEKVRRKPYSVILFDEMEKAHPDVMNMLLQILEDGRLTDSQGRTVNFKNTIIIMTSNVGAKLITDKNKLGFANDKSAENEKQEYENIKKEVLAELKKQFRPEFINRIDDIIVFHKLNNEDINKIMEIMLKQVQKRLELQNYKVEIDDSAKELIAKKGVDTNYGARPLRRAIQNMLEDKIAEAILEGVIKPKKKAKAVVKDDKIVIE
mgnify:CR=1 FL=1